MSDHNLEQRLDFIGLDQAARATLRDLKPIIAAELSAALDGFYAQVRRFPETRKFFSSDGQMSKAQGAQLGHWNTITDASYDGRYVEAVRAIGETHARIGLEPRWYIGGYARVADHMIRAMVDKAWPAKRFGRRPEGGPELGDQVSTLIKAIMLDMDFAISVYLDAAERERARTEATAIAQQQDLVNNTFGEALKRLAAGDLTHRLTADLPSAYEPLKRDFNAAAATLMETIQGIAGAVHQIQSGSGEISTAADDLSRRTEQQAAGLEQTAAALDEITATVSLTADGAGHAREVVTSTRASAERGGRVVGDAIAAMSEIARSSKEVNQIIGVIDEIAFQTNLLALNAGVEAARAGDAGKGFAVVASEVRALAQRSAEAAKEIKALISTSGQQVDLGVDLVTQTGSALSEILGQITEIDSAVDEIAASAREQALGLGQVNTAVNQMDQVTQQNAAMVEQSTAASHALMREAESLQGLVGRFSVEARPAAPVQRPSARAAAPVLRAQGSAALRAQPQADTWEEF